MCRKQLVLVKKSTFDNFPMFFIIILAMMTAQIDGYMESAEFISDLDRPGNFFSYNIRIKY